jgi:hypothetical protein
LGEKEISVNMKNFFPTVVNKPWIHEELQEETFRVKGNTVIHANEGEKKDPLTTNM